MESTLPNIQEKIDAIQAGLLRYSYKGKKVSHFVKITMQNENNLNCILTEDLPVQKLLNKTVSLIQKDRNNFIYISGYISREVRTNRIILSIDINKACWYILKSKGSVSWLQEKFVYLPELKIAS